MAPEQAAGRVREIGPLCDVYALGAILYELLTGRPPFLGDTWSQTVEQVIRDEPQPPSQWQPEVPRELETICLKCLEKEPGRRYASAEELADDLGRFLEGKPLSAVRVSDAERRARLASRDGYQLVGEVGRGPRSVVYRAVSGSLKQPVALKVFAAGVCAREEWESRFARCAEQGAVLSHPQVVLVQRTGWWDDAPYVAMDFVPHGSLATPMPGKRRSVREVLRLVEQVTEIVGYLHRQGVVHGNLKPSNVLLAADGIPRVTDFRPTGGLAHSLTSVEGDASGLGALAPELIEDPNAEPRPNTDVYGLGVILYELLTDRPPIAEATAQETLEAVRSREPAPPSSFNPDVTPGLDKVCLRCLRKNPWHRYPRAYDLLIRLRHFQDDPDAPFDSGIRRRRPPN
jgi:serine/threonine protein kinase